MQATHNSHVSVVLVAKATPNADMSLTTWLESLQSRSVNSRHTKIKSQNTDNSLQLFQRGVGGQGRSQRRNVAVADIVACKTANKTNT